MKRFLPAAILACMAAAAPAAFAVNKASATGLSQSPQTSETTRRGSPLKGVRIGRVFTQPAPAIEH